MSVVAQAEFSSYLYGEAFCHKSGFKCKPVKEGDTWSKLFPNIYRRAIVMRLNRTNVALKYSHKIILPKDMRHLDYMSMSPFPYYVEPTGHKLIKIDLNVFAFAAYNEDGDLVFWGPATGGRDHCEDSDESCRSAIGKFKIYRIQGELCESSKYPLETDGGAPMPYCMHYFKGYAIHGSTLMGFRNMSQGCVRLFYGDAKWLNEHFIKYGTRVIVQG